MPLTTVSVLKLVEDLAEGALDAPLGDFAGEQHR